MARRRGRGWLALLLIASGPAAWPADTENVSRGRWLLEQATEGFFGETLPPRAVGELLDSSRAAFDAVTDACDRSYWHARVDVIRGFLERSQGRTREAEARFVRAQEQARASVSCRETSDGYRVLADTYGQLITFRGVLYALANGRKLMQLCEKALALDESNFDARLTRAIAYLHAPAIAGGSADRSLGELRRLQALPALTRLQQFSIAIWVALALDKKGERALARASLESAAALYPSNNWVRGLLEQTARP